VDNRNIEIQFKKEHFLRQQIRRVISRGSVATYLRCSRHCYMGFVANFIRF